LRARYASVRILPSLSFLGADVTAFFRMGHDIR
jgi:hypothetical protein